MTQMKIFSGYHHGVADEVNRWLALKIGTKEDYDKDGRKIFVPIYPEVICSSTVVVSKERCGLSQLVVTIFYK